MSQFTREELNAAKESGFYHASLTGTKKDGL